jgi:hypothetical protein
MSSVPFDGWEVEEDAMDTMRIPVAREEGTFRNIP